jgi:hypothetical protein
MTVALGVSFEQDVDAVVARLVGEQLEDGGWNCEAENGSVRSSSTPRSEFWKDCWPTSARRVARRSRSGRAAAVRSTCSSASCSGERAPVQSSIPRGCGSRFPLALRRAARSRVLPLRRGSAEPARGRSDRLAPIQAAVRRHVAASRTPMPARSTSRSRTATVDPAAGTRCERCACFAGTSGDTCSTPLSVRTERRTESCRAGQRVRRQ